MYGICAANIVGVVYGAIGIHIEHVTPGQLEVYSKSLLALIILWASSLAAIKISLLLLYIRIFVLSSLRITAYIVMGVVVSWWLSVVLEEFLLCRPFAFNWDRSIPDGTCGNLLNAYIAAGAINLITDVMVLCLPIPVIWNLHLPQRAKIALSGVFGLGFIVCVFTAIRISTVVSYNILDPTFSMWKTAIWSQLEPSLGIICGCLPLMRPILDRCIVRRKGTMAGSGGSASLQRAGARHTSAVNKSNEAYPLTTNTFISSKRASGYEELPEPIGKQSGKDVLVERDWTVVYSTC